MNPTSEAGIYVCKLLPSMKHANIQNNVWGNKEQAEILTCLFIARTKLKQKATCFYSQQHSDFVSVVENITFHLTVFMEHMQIKREPPRT